MSKRKKPMQVTIEAVMKYHGLLEKFQKAVGTAVSFHVRVENDPFMCLVVEVLPNRGEISVAHYFEQCDDLVADPEIVFSKEWHPVEVTMGPTGYYRRAPEGYHLNLGGFDRQWGINIRNQGYAESSVLVSLNGEPVKTAVGGRGE